MPRPGRRARREFRRRRISARRTCFVSQPVSAWPLARSHARRSHRATERRRQGEGERGRQGVFCLSPCLPVSLSPCLPLSLAPRLCVFVANSGALIKKCVSCHLPSWVLWVLWVFWYNWRAMADNYFLTPDQ